MSRAINVYLDSQDYSAFCKDDLPKEIEEVKLYLLSEIEKGSVVIGYSYPILFELLRKSDAKHLENRQVRAKTIKQLCGSNAHPYPTDLKTGRSFPNDGIWVPFGAFESITADFVRKKFHEPIEKILADPRLTRQQRQKLKSTRGRKELLRSMAIGPFSKADFGDLPVPSKMLEERIVERYVRGELSATSVVIALRQWMSDPENLMEIWYEYAGLPNPIEKIVADTAAPLFGNLKQMSILLRQHRASLSNYKRSQRELRKLINQINIDPSVPGISELLAPVANLSIDFPKKKFEEMFGDGRGDMFEAYVSSIVLDEHNPEESDIVDMLHFLYIKDVDLFRCDRKMNHLLGRKTSAHQHKIVPRLLELPARVEALKDARTRRKD